MCVWHTGDRSYEPFHLTSFFEHFVTDTARFKKDCLRLSVYLLLFYQVIMWCEALSVKGPMWTLINHCHTPVLIRLYKRFAAFTGSATG